MSRLYALPTTTFVRSTDGTTLAVIPDGRKIPVNEWKTMRVTPDEFYRLMTLKRQNDRSGWDPINQTRTEPDIEEPDYF